MEENIIGLNVKEGIKNCGSKELFYSLVRDFYRLIDIKSEKVEICLKNHEIREYTIEVHALKSMARMIGAFELSQQFYELEKFGNAEQFDEIYKRTDEVLDFYRSYKKILSSYVKEDSTGELCVSLQQIYDVVKDINTAIDHFELDLADEKMCELKKYILPDQIKPLFDRLSTALIDVAMDEVLQLTDEICAALKESIQTEKPLLMLIDDDSMNAKAVKVMLQEEYEVQVASSGKEAFSMLDNQKPDLILLDVYMPQMDGHQVIKFLKSQKEYEEIPVIFLTSDEDEETEIQGLSEGAIDFIRKPFRKNAALMRIKRILELSYLQKHLRQEVVKQTQEAEKRRKSLERLSMQMVQALASTIDAKDSYTSGHSERVAKYSVMLAERMGYKGERLEQLQYAAMLHDVGKIGVPREIINKPTRLTDEEYEIIKTHSSIGGNILKSITEIPDIAIGARWHHERYDGHGYPDGLKGEEIPELARIIGVADSYDAMTSKRSYRDVLPQEVVIGELEKGKSTQFDEKIAQLMINLIREDKEYVMHE